MKIKDITPIEYDDRWELTIGKVAPWDRKIAFKLPKRLAVKFL